MTATATRSRTAKLTKAKPLVVDLGEVTSRFTMTDHAIKRCEDRGVGVFEVYSAIAEPDRSQPDADDPDKLSYVRGDISVVVAQNAIITVIDRHEDERPTPRTPLDPMKAGAMAPRVKHGNPQVLDEAWILVAHTEEDYRKITITPALADKLLGLNTHNRPIRTRDVAEWKRKMTSGEYRPTHQGIALDTNGILQDGQHRLSAIVDLDVAQVAWVAVGMPPDNFAITDTGRNRNYSDVLALSGEADTAVLGATVRAVWLYLNYDGSTNSGSTPKVSNSIVMETFTKDAGRFRESAKVANRMRHAAYGLTAASAAAGWYLIRRVNTAARTDEFFDGIISGASIPSGDPRLVLGRKLRNDKERKTRAYGTEHIALLIKCWNMWATGAENVRLIAWRKGEKMPSVTKAG